MIICTLIYVTMSTTRRGPVRIGKLALQITFALQHLFWYPIGSFWRPFDRSQRSRINRGNGGGAGYRELPNINVNRASRMAYCLGCCRACWQDCWVACCQACRFACSPARCLACWPACCLVCLACWRAASRAAGCLACCWLAVNLATCQGSPLK